MQDFLTHVSYFYCQSRQVPGTPFLTHCHSHVTPCLKSAIVSMSPRPTTFQLSHVNTEDPGLLLLMPLLPTTLQVCLNFHSQNPLVSPFEITHNKDQWPRLTVNPSLFPINLPQREQKNIYKVKSEHVISHTLGLVNNSASSSLFGKCRARYSEVTEHCA